LINHYIHILIKQEKTWALYIKLICIELVFASKILYFFGISF